MVALGLGLFIYHIVQDDGTIKEVAVEEEVSGEDDFNHLLPVVREDDSNNLKFEYFLKIFETAQAHARKEFASVKAVKLAERRAALKEGTPESEKRYEALAAEMAQAEEQLTNDYLMKILEVIDVDQNEF